MQHTARGLPGQHCCTEWRVEDGVYRGQPCCLLLGHPAAGLYTVYYTVCAHSMCSEVTANCARQMTMWAIVCAAGSYTGGIVCN